MEMGCTWITGACVYGDGQYAAPFDEAALLYGSLVAYICGPVYLILWSSPGQNKVFHSELQRTVARFLVYMGPPSQTSECIKCAE